MSSTKFYAGVVSGNQKATFHSDETIIKEKLREEVVAFSDDDDIFEVFSENWEESWGIIYVEGKGLFDFHIQDSGEMEGHASVCIEGLGKNEKVFFLVFYNGGTCFPEMLEEFIQDNF